jgi:fumarate reductase subunit C
MPANANILREKVFAFRRSRWPARLDVIQSLTGLFLILFVWMHSTLEASILISKDAMYRIARAMEGHDLFGADYPILVSLAGVPILILFMVHGALALRKFPNSYRQYRAFKEHAAAFAHEDTNLWWLQVWTGFVLFFLGSVHILGIMASAADIGPYESADRIVSGWMWPIYALLLIAVHLHGGVGAYRLAVKWGLHLAADPIVSRRRLKLVRRIIIGFFLVLGFASLGRYIVIGIEHRDHRGERYVPTWEQGVAAPAVPQQAGSKP